MDAKTGRMWWINALEINPIKYYYFINTFVSPNHLEQNKMAQNGSSEVEKERKKPAKFPIYMWLYGADVASHKTFAAITFQFLLWVECCTKQPAVTNSKWDKPTKFTLPISLEWADATGLKKHLQEPHHSACCRRTLHKTAWDGQIPGRKTEWHSTVTSDSSRLMQQVSKHSQETTFQ